MTMLFAVFISDRELAWFERGMPKQFSYCQMLIDEDNDNGLVLVDFSFRPVDVLSSITCWLLMQDGKIRKMWI